MKSSDLVFYSTDLLFYKFAKISLNCGGSYIDSSEQIKNKKATLNPNNSYDNCFQYAIAVALNHKKLKRIHKEYQILNPLQTNMNGKKLVFCQITRTEKHF